MSNPGEQIIAGKPPYPVPSLPPTPEPGDKTGWGNWWHLWRLGWARLAEDQGVDDLTAGMFEEPKQRPG